MNRSSISSCHEDLDSATFNRKVGAALAPGVHPESAERERPRPDHRAPSKPFGKLRDGSELPRFLVWDSLGVGGESCPAQPQPSPSRVWPH